MEVKPKIFLSYARLDEGKVKDLYQKLSNTGFEPWMDKENILPGEKWEFVIQQAIRNSDFFIACMSTNSVDQRGILQKEIKQALDIWKEKVDNDIYIIPVLLENCEVPASLRDFQWVNPFENDGWTRLVKAIETGMKRSAVEKLYSPNDRQFTHKEKLVKAENSIPPCTVELIIKIELQEFGVQNQALLQNALALFLEISSKDVQITSIQKGSVKVTIELPAKSAEKLLNAYKINDPELIKHLASFVLIDLRIVTEREVKNIEPTPRTNTSQTPSSQGKSLPGIKTATPNEESERTSGRSRKRTITWLHLSDLHFKSDKAAQQFNRKIVLEALWTDIEKQIRSGLKPDFIIFSGDVAYHGKKSEFDLAAKDFFDPLLKITGLAKDRLFVVPGNHDIDRGKITPNIRDGMLAQLDDRDRINQFLSAAHDKERSLVFEKFHAYAEFIQNYFSGHLTFGDTDYFYTKIIPIEGYKIAILGLNSAWMCGYGKNYKGEAFDLNHLLIGEWQLEQALERTKEAEWRIAVVHHPITWLRETDHLWIKRRLEAKCNFILHGHLHIPEVYDTRSLSGHTVYIPCGAVYASRDYPNGYNFVNIDLDSLKGKVYLRKYNDKGRQGPEWIKDIDSTGEEIDGMADFNFSRKTSEDITRVVEQVKTTIPLVETVKKAIPLPVVIIAMTKEEARQLFANKKNSDIAKLYKLIKNLNIQNIIDRYDIKDKDKWRPFGTSPYNIREILENFAQETEIPANHHSFRVKFEFQTALFFNDDPAIKLQVLETLKRNGCLFIVDGLSIFHAEIFTRFLAYITGTDAQLVHFILSPMDFREHELSKLFERHIDKFLPRFFIDHDHHLSPHCGFFCGNKIDLSRHMKTSLKELNLTGRMMKSWQEAFVNAGISGTGMKEYVS